MKKVLKRNECKCWYYENGIRKKGIHSGITGDVSRITGDVSGIYGDVSRITGDVSGIYGDVSRITGDLDKCEITEAERFAGINIQDLIESSKKEEKQ